NKRPRPPGGEGGDGARADQAGPWSRGGRKRLSRLPGVPRCAWEANTAEPTATATTPPKRWSMLSIPEAVPMSRGATRVAMRSVVLGARAQAAEARLNSARPATYTRRRPKCSPMLAAVITMKKATEVRSSAQPVLVGCLGAAGRVGDIGCLLCWWVLGLLAWYG